MINAHADFRALQTIAAFGYHPYLLVYPFSRFLHRLFLPERT